MTYQETLDWLFAQLPMYQRIGQTAFKKDLNNTLAFADVLGNPHRKFKSIHVAGTNGKGSTSHMLASVLQEAGYKVGLYTSPHLKDFRERIRVNGQCIPKRTVSSLITKHKAFLEQQGLSFFEMTVGMAFYYFAKEQVDIAVIEVGLGGRLDSTNIITPELSVITNIGLDHTAMLGHTLKEIAFEKGGIIKPHIPVVIGENQKDPLEVFNQLAQDRESPVYYGFQYGGKMYDTALKGGYQQHNVKTVLTAVEVLNTLGWTITDRHLEDGLQYVIKNTGLMGRWQIMSEQPAVIADIAHNKDGLTYTMSQLQAMTYKQLHMVIGVVNDKDLEMMLALLPPQAIYYFCKPDVPRGLDVSVLHDEAQKYGLKGKSYASVKTALKAAQKQACADDVIYVGGSAFVVAEVV
ncbi:MAG: tetrahydrofolate synthase [Flavobacteriia bacterium]|nr:MAG: tetrahydrofolate synthase [Flavobacteriia bacterium]